ncbi:MAG: NAD(P)H-dependent oxidoreductase [Bacteroidales bacterium]|jgi:NAD(P)H dehydrogenase (quinone)|nr:NAD(P)H-dependent oxidoreductase [Bacteroidales bacterium]
MNVLIILGHPNNNSFNHAIAAACRTQAEANGHVVYFHDLYAEKFDPVAHLENVDSDSDVPDKSHCLHLKSCDAIIIIHPNWWGQAPAIVKGWIDRIFLPGVAYDFELNEKGDYIPVGLLKANSALVLTTSNTPNKGEDDVLDGIWKDIVLNTCGVSDVKRFNFGMVSKSDDKERADWLLKVKLLVNSLFSRNG